MTKRQELSAGAFMCSIIAYVVFMGLFLLLAWLAS